MEADAAELTPTVAGNLLQGRESVPGLKLLLTIGEMLTQHIDLDPKILDLMSDESDIDRVSHCTPLQDAMLAETSSRSNAYCNWIELELGVKLTYDEISSAISSLAKDNEILRSGFCANDSGSYVQITWKNLLMTQVESVSHFQKSYGLGTAQEMLRPFRVQIQLLLRQIDEIVNIFLEDTNCTTADVGRCFTRPSLSVANPDPRRINSCVSLSHAVEMWASASPDKDAIIFGQCLDGTMKVRRTITYSVLNSRANQLARLLSQKGVGQDQLVCILMEKSIDLYVAILAVFKLGSGYLPLVPGTPVERIVRPSVTSTDLINNIGAPFDNTSVFVLDPNSDEILPRGAVGELCFGGEQVFRGYLNRPELNAAKIINLANYGRVYRSGDMGRLLPSNDILFSGRLDDQVKIRGQRVELGEITSIVLDEDGVADCATLLLKRDNDVQTLVAFWVPKVRSSEHFEILHGKHLRPVQLQTFDALSRQLPEYMVPSYLIPISKIPMTPQAKIDKRLLQTSLVGLTDDALAQSAPALTNNCENGCETSGMIPALSNWESSVAEILARILSINVEGIRRSSSFFNLGLDSVSAIRFCNTLRRSGLGDFTIATVLKNPTISNLGALQIDHSVSSDDNERPPRRLQNIFTDDQKAQICSTYDKLGLQIEKINPCTPLQEAMLASGASSDAAYNNTMVFDLKGDVTHLKACWKLAQARHEILRTSFVTTNDSSYAFAQVVLKDVELEWVPLSTLENLQSCMDTIVSKQLLAREPPLCLGVHETQTTSKFVLSCHHALYDGVAIANLLEEIQQIYVNRTLPPVVPYDRYLQHMISQDLHKADIFWSGRFTGFEPTYFPDLTGRVHQSCGVSKSIRRDLHLPLRVVRTACQRASVSILSVVQAAWVKLLHFYTDENDLCFGNVVSGRALPEDGLDHLVAPCFNTLPVRVKFDFQEPNSALLKLLQSFNVESLAHQLTPLRRIQGVALKDGGRLFDSLVILQQPSKPLDETLWTLEEDVSQMDLPVVCEVHQDDQHDILRLTLHFDTCLLSEKDAHIAAETFDNNFVALVRQSNAAAKDCSSIAPALRAESNMCFTQLPSDFDELHRAFEVNASSLQTQHGIALDFLHCNGKRTSWSYQELNLRGNHIATRLIHCGVGLEDIVPIHIAKSPTFYASILGVLKAGAAFAPVHPDLPAARKELMLEELKPKAILCTDSTMLNHVQQTHATIIDVRDIETGSFCACENPYIENLTGANLAYCLYTSGSTGVPKAVSMEHRSPIQTLESSRSLIPWKLSSRLLQYAAITFDMCYYDCFLAWSFGFTLCAAEQHSMFNDLPHIINTLDVTLLDLTPSVAASLPRSQVPGVEWLYCIGEAMSTDVAEEWCGACVNSYGPTEAAFCTTMFPVSEHMKTSVIGQPYHTTSFAVFSALEEQPLPMLGVGELYIGGTQLARSYLGRPELSDERFVSKRGQRFYKSGDMVRMLSDGNFEFIGRVDDQVKIRGLRVELGEINNVLKDCDTRVSSVVTQILKKDVTAKEQLVAFLATRDRIGDDEQIELREKAMHAARNRLPAYMVPQFCLFVDKIPRSMAAKVDKKALSYIFETATTDNAASSSYHTWTGTELSIRNILSELSRTSLDDISPTATIYQLGLDSISAVQIAAALRRNGYNASASDVMRFNNCVDLALQIKKTSTSEAQTKQFNFSAFDQKHRSAVLKNCGLEDGHVEAIYPCTPLQQGMISQFIAKDGAVYYNYLRLGLNVHDTSIVKLQNAWAKTMTRHPILRTGFAHVKDDEYPFAMVQYTPDSVRLPWSSGIDTDAGLATEILEHLQRKALIQLHQPMWHIRIVGIGEELFLDLSIFHALFDAHSLQLIFNDVVAIYNDRLLPETAPLQPILSELLQLDSNQNEKTENFWTDLGKRAVPSRFPNLSPLRHKPRPSVVLEKRSSMSVPEVEEGCRAANTTLQSIGIASWSSIVSAYTGEAEVTIGVVLSGRTSEMANNAAFPCINTVPFPCTVTKNKTTILKATMALITDMLQHQFIPLGQIQKLAGMPHEPLFDSLFAYQKSSGGSQQTELWDVWEEKATTEYPISIELELTKEYLEYRLTYLPHIIPSEQANTILEQLDHIMQSFIISEGNSVPQYSTSPSLYSITPAEEPTLPSDVRLLHDFVELTATQHPNRVAFEFADSIIEDGSKCRKWTYCELDAEGNRIAHLLQSYDVNPGSLVAVCFDKCPEASFAILGILKAGCAFVAIDPSAPSARQAFIVKDSGARVVLSMSTQSLKFSEIIEVPILELDQMALADVPAFRPSLERNIDSQDRSYCLYTSGTTGTPKACELTHENAVQAMLAFQRLFAGHWDEKSRWLQFASFHFDVSVLEQYWSWSVGICVVSAPRDTIFEDIANAIRTLDITHIDLTPSLAQVLHPDDVPSLCKGVFITGGESLKQEILDVWGPKSVIYNGYGPTEATIGCTMYPRVPANGKPSNIGTQFDNVGSYVLIPDSDIPVLRGAVGELCVSGKLVGKGYLNRPELTAERFPYLDRFNERVYRTGDLVRILHNGTFDFLGRADDQVKLRGQRLEIGEINSVIRQSSKNFADVATLVLKHPKQQKEQIVTFVAIGAKSSLEPTVLLTEVGSLVDAKEACQKKLPPYMIPTHFVPLPSMPLNVNNKADGKKLKQFYEALTNKELQQLSTSAAGPSPILSKQEESLRRVLAGALRIDEESIDRNSSFYELGMDSISVIGISQALKQAGFAQATASVLLRHFTIGRLASVLSTPDYSASSHGSLRAAQQVISSTQHRYRRTVAQLLAINSRDIEALAPCTPLQQGMIARYLDSDDGLYFNTFRFSLSDFVDIARLRFAWEQVFDLTQTLRTVFVHTDDGYIQAVLQGIPLPWNEETVREEESIFDCLKRLKVRWLEANRMELNRLFEINLIGKPGAQSLAVHIFHGLYDGNSIELLFEWVRGVYERWGVDRDPTPTFHEALAYGPLRAAEGAKDFWKAHLSDRTPKSFPRLTTSPVRGAVMVTREFNSISAYDTTRRKLNVTAQAIAQACWLHALQETTQAPITVGMVVSGRSLDFEGVDRIVGPMFNTIPYQHRTQSGDTWASAITRVHKFNIAALPYQHTPLRDIMKWCKRTPNQPLFDSLFAYRIEERKRNWIDDRAVWEIHDDFDAVADYRLAFEVEQKSNGTLSLTLVTQGDISDEKTSNELLDQFEQALKTALAEPSTILDVSVSSNNSDLNETAQSAPVPDGIVSAAEFEWTHNAVVLREEISILTGVTTSEIAESTSIFELGLDSIDAIKLSAKLKKRDIQLSVSSIMRELTIQKMCNSTSDIQPEETRSQIDREFELCKSNLRRCLEQDGVALSELDNVLPLTPLQEAMVAEMIASGHRRYYNFDVSQLAADTDLDKLQDAWHNVIVTSPVLRTAFVEIDDPHIEGAFAQVVAGSVTIDSYVEKRSTVEYGDPDFPAMFDNLRRMAEQSEPLQPPFKVRLFENSGQKYQVLAIAHALYDGWSLGLLHDAVHAAYYGEHTPSPSYEATLADILSGSGSDAAKFWEDYLTGVKPSLFSRCNTDPVEKAEEVHRWEYVSDMEMSSITAFAKSSKVSLQTLGQTAFALTLASYVGSLDVTFGCVLSGRDDDTRSQLLFPTMNTVAIRTVLHGTRLEMLQYVQDNFNNIKQWQHFPLRRAIALTHVQGKLFDSLFIYQKQAESFSTKEKLYDSIQGQSDVEYPICVEMEAVDGQLIWRCAIKQEVLSLKGARLLLKRLDEVLCNIVEHSDFPTIDSTPQGTSVCGLSVFEEDGFHTPDIDNTHQRDAESANVPLSETATKIRNALAFVSQIPEKDITRDMTIFHIGLDSISTIKVSSILRKQGVVISVGELLKAGTVEKMAEFADMRTASTVDQDTGPAPTTKQALSKLDLANLLSQHGIEVSKIDRCLPITAGQLYMLSMWLNTQGANFYPEFVYNIRSSQSFETLQKSWQALVKANPILRTRIVATKQSDVPYIQVVLRQADALLVDITGQDAVTAKHSMDNVTGQQPWVHAFLAQTTVGWILKLRVHHVFYDGVSLPHLLRQFMDICSDASSAVAEDTLDEYIAVAHTESAISSRKSFWKSYLEGVIVQLNPRKESAPESRTEIFKPGFLSTMTTEAFARQHGVSVQALFLATYAKLHSTTARGSDRKDVVIGIYLANRSSPIANLPTAAMPTVNLVPLRIQSPLSSAIHNIAAQIQRDLQDISNPMNAAVSLYEISEWTSVKVDTFVNFLTLPDTEDEHILEDNGSKITPKHTWQKVVSRVTEVDQESLGHAIDVEATIRNGHLDIGVFAPTQMLSLQDGEKLVEDIRLELENLRTV
ncbi:hypothetical protein N0V94_001107 [Neodidymelliopsis sp. IMI 364377]|nr:hypothetical protein N0V94_001107 [Neodidymelliopsis sp. IMI 364377]